VKRKYSITSRCAIVLVIWDRISGQDDSDYYVSGLNSLNSPKDFERADEAVVHRFLFLAHDRGNNIKTSMVSGCCGVNDCLTL
jgi:hypothetical protein